MTLRLAVVVVGLFGLALPALGQAQPARPRGRATARIEAALLARHGEASRARIERGVRQVAALWRASDGDLAGFCAEHFIADGKLLDATFARYQANLEQLRGHLLEIGRELRKPSDLDLGPMLPIDPLFGAYDPAAHVADDLFGNKLAFVALLNFPLSTLAQRLERGETMTRRDWAEARLTDQFARRIPGAVRQKVASAAAAAELYIAEYNLWMHHVLGDKGERLFPKGKRLISHWNLRDELKASYADKAGAARQRAIVKVMERIVTQTIPAAVIDNPGLDWNPYSNAVTAAPADTVEADGPRRPTRPEPRREADVRYARLLANFKAAREVDRHSPFAPTEIARAFELSAEMPEARVEELLTAVLTSPLVPRVAALIEKQVGRKLEPHDLWFNGFLPRGKIDERKLDAATRKRYPDAAAFARDIPRILEALGFPRPRAAYLAKRIVVEASRGAGHAMGAERRGDLPHLRTRIEAGGMDYKGYNIAVHELGHNVEQVLSLYDVDQTLLAGVPNTAFTEAMAFVFQAKDLELLGLARPDAASERLRVLNDFWATWEIAGVALVDLEVWRWLYAHPGATPAKLREATVAIARRVWNQYYQPVLAGKDSALLGIYSHMISSPLYLFNYPLGHLIAFQIEEQIARAGKLGVEFERMAKFGRLAPDLWMKHATGAPVSAAPLLRATEAALAR